jgi:hypothetical protein
MKLLATSIAALLLTVPPAFSCTDTQINGGTLEFDYSQTGGGPIAGSFFSDGSLVLDPANQGTAAATYSLDGLEYLVVVGGVDNGSDFADVGVIIVRGAVAPGPGPYGFDGVNAFFFFVDDAVGYTVPADICAANWTLELVGAVAAGKYGATTGTVTFNTASSTSVSGTFSGMAIDPTSFTTLLISNGAFNVEGTTAIEASTWGGVKNAYR